jgi:hypothetical protein
MVPLHRHTPIFTITPARTHNKVMRDSLDLAAELQKIYDSEINVRISWLWDCGIDVWLGDEVNGYVAEENLAATADIAPWLQEAIAHFYPTSTYAASLSPEIRERGAVRLFRAPRIAAQVNCPHFGAPNAVTGMEEVFAFVCSHCGNTVEVKSPKVQ